ncbi:MAG: TetR/AcrR family transcriptional regulator [Acidimicrobiales bacterium]
MMVSTRQTADERRTAVLAAAITEFARSGYAGTSTDAIAHRAGISQPYLFRLFGTKKDLFIATYDLVGGRIIQTLTAAGDGLHGEEALRAMGAAYVELMQDPDLLQVQLHGFAAASGDADIARSCRHTFDVLWHMVDERTHLPEDVLHQFFSTGMMISVMAAIDLLSIPDHWAQSLCPHPEKAEGVAAAACALRRRQEHEPDATAADGVTGTQVST